MDKYLYAQDTGNAIPAFVVLPSGCWMWTRKVNRGGYGVLIRSNRTVIVHRDVYEAFNGAIPPGYQIDHLCRLRSCVNPVHLEAVTPRENNFRSFSPPALNLRKSVCPQGHALSKLREYPSNARRDCDICANTRRRKS